MVEQEGIRRSFGRARAADLVLWLTDASAPIESPLSVPADRLLRVANKCDLLQGRALQPPVGSSIAVSARTGFGLERLTRQIAATARARMGETESPVLTQARHRLQLEHCRAALSSFLSAPIEEVELRAEDLRRAAQAIGRVIGAVDVEDVLDQIFSRFCIGK